MFDIGIAVVLFVFAFAIGRGSRKHWTRADYFVYYLLWLVVAFFATYGFVNTFF